MEADFRVREDFFGNQVAYFSITSLIMSSASPPSVKYRSYPAATQLNFSQGMAWENVREVLQENLSPQNLDARQYVLDSPLISASHELSGYAQDSFHAGRPLLEAVYDLMQRIYHDFTFDPEFTTLATPLSEVLEHRRGVCRILLIWLSVACVHRDWLHATSAAISRPCRRQAKRNWWGADASHAWFAVFIPEQGWMDFDPTNNQVPNDQHITVAWGRDYSDVTPLKGVIFGGKDHELSVSVDVQRLGE